MNDLLFASFWFQKHSKTILLPIVIWSKTLPDSHGPVHHWLEHPLCPDVRIRREVFNELMDTPLDFSAFMMNRLKVDTLTPKLLAGLTFKLMKGSCKSLVELEYFFAEVYKATTDQLDWNNLEGQQYPHDLRKPLPLIPNSRVEWHNYKHLDWITVRRDDDKLYKFKEGDFNRLRIQDIEDMVLLLVQGKLTNITIEECLSFNVSLRMFTRSVVIQRRVEDLQLVYSNPRGFINQNKEKKNRLMRIDEIHKFSDGTLNDVRTALDDRLKGIRMKYLPQTIWRQTEAINQIATNKAITSFSKMPLEQFKLTRKFLNTLPDEWSKFVTDVKLVKDLHTTNVDQLHAYLQQHERHANEVRLMHARNSDPLALVASHQLTQPAYQSHLQLHPRHNLTFTFRTPISVLHF
ncbi:hypothetical protein Tco_0628543 [Tanacetum coccineum]|uniref:Uncharacterized protein n=1 Tax=Tanacetum coccineum TaxID=301880 RepID=A0ABQ4WQK8_9ASTR